MKKTGLSTQLEQFSNGLKFLPAPVKHKENLLYISLFIAKHLRPAFAKASAGKKTATNIPGSAGRSQFRFFGPP